MQKVITYQEAIEQKIVKVGNYIKVTYPDGREKLFRIMENGEWIGSPTDEEVLFEGKYGYNNYFELANDQAKKEYDFPEVFEEVHAFRFPEEEYEFKSYARLEEFCKRMSKKYIHPDDEDLTYVVASRCVYYNSIFASFRMFYVGSGSVGADYLYGAYNGAYSNSYAVRPVAIPKSTMLLQLDGCNGSKKKPFICLGSQEKCECGHEEEKRAVQEVYTVDYNKAELQRLIQKSRERLAKAKCLIQEEEECLKELEEYVETLK